MDIQQGRVLESIRAVQNFLDKHADRLGDVNKTGVRQQLDKVVTDLSGHVTSQTAHTFGGLGATRKQRALRRALLKDHMRPIARIATADLPPTPEVQPLTMPSGKPSVALLIATARGMAAAAGRFATVFTDAGLPADFVAQLTAATDALEAARDQQTSTVSSRSGATDVLGATLQRGRRIVGVLDSLVAKALNDDPELMAGWRSAKRVRHIGRPTATAGMTTPTAPRESVPNAAPAAPPAATPAAAEHTEPVVAPEAATVA